MSVIKLFSAHYPLALDDYHRFLPKNDQVLIIRRTAAGPDLESLCFGLKGELFDLKL